MVYDVLSPLVGHLLHILHSLEVHQQDGCGVFLHIFRHIDPNHRILIPEHRLPRNARANSVLPTPVGPRKINEPIGRLDL